MIKKKLKLYYKSLIELFFSFLYGKIILPKTTKNLIKKIEINNSFFKSFKNKKYQIYIIQNARIYTDNNENLAIIKNNLILPHISFQQVYGVLRSSKYNCTLLKGTPSFLKKINGKVFNLCQGASGNNYFHFMFDVVPKIYLLNSKIDLNKIDFFYIANPKKWQIKILKDLGIPKDKLLSSKKYNHIIADEIYTVDHPWYIKGTIQNSVKEIPSWIVLKNRDIFLKKNRKNTKKRIFLDRSNSSYNHCQISNPNFVNKFLLKNKFKSLKPEFLTFKSQINLFNNSSIIIGAHGANLANIIFCQPRTKIIELIPADHPNRQCERISKILNLKYFRIKTKPNNSDINYPFRIDVEEKHLKSIKKIISL